MPPLPKSAVFDLDGTLAQSKQAVSPEMGALLGELLRRMPVAVMSGGALPQFKRQLLPALPPGAPLERLFLFPDSGAQCFCLKDGEWRAVYDEALSSAERERVRFAITQGLEGLGSGPEHTWGERLEDRGAAIAFSFLGQEAPLPEKERWHAEHDDLRHRLREALIPALPDFTITLGGLTTVDITRKGIDKAYGVTRLAERTGIAPAEMLYIGDALGKGGNDEAVIKSGIRTQAVAGPEETASLIRTLLA